LRIVSFFAVVWGIAAFLGHSAPARAQAEAQAAQGPPLNVGIFLSSDPAACYESGYDAAIRFLTEHEVARLNRRGGVDGRPLQINFYDDMRDPRQTVANAKQALADPQLLAMVGLTSSDLGKVLFNGSPKDGIDGLGEDIAKSGVPFITDMSVSGTFAKYANVFSTRPSQDEGNAPIVSEFIKESGYSKVALIVNNDKLYSRTLADAVAAGAGTQKVVADHRVGEKDKNSMDPEAIRIAVADLKEKAPDIVVIAVGSARTAPIITAMKDAGMTAAVFIIGILERIPEEVRNSYPGPFFELTMSDLPEVHNAMLGELVRQGEPGDWIFEGAKRDNAAGWTDGSCKPRDNIQHRDPLEGDNRRAIERASQFADMIALVAAGANAAEPGSDPAARRMAVVEALTTTYASGSGAFRGRFNNWSFDARTRVAVRPLLLIILPTGAKNRRRQLAPFQFLRLRDGSLRRIDTLYIDIDLVRAHRADDNEKTFLAEFYLSMRANQGADIERLDFTNAYVDQRSNGRQITIEKLHDGSPDAAYPDRMKIYRVSGRFLFKPDLKAYPFDTQRFFIEIKPLSGTAFLVQPPPQSLRDRDVASDDWQATGQYVGLGEDFIPIVDAYTHAPSVVPFYKAQYVWLMQREVNDYVLRVIAPLLFILIVAYVSIFIPHPHFEAIVTIQVTALLSAVALYLSLPQLDSDTATLSDRLFLFYYLMVSVMIIITIARINKHVAARKWLKLSLGFVHTLGIPLAVAAMAWHVYALSQSGA